MTNKPEYKYDTYNPYIFFQIPHKAKVLDVGCATGLLGNKLREEKSVSFVAGIENDLKMAEAAKNNYNKLVNINLEEFENLPFEKGYFDVIVCADVLEHLHNPVRAMVKLSDYLSRDGFFLISVPNIAFISVRLQLLFGKFDYTSGGILDETHLRFFTKKTLDSLLKKANLTPDYVRGYNLVRPVFFFLKILGFIFPSLFCIQFLAKARKAISSS